MLRLKLNLKLHARKTQSQLHTQIHFVSGERRRRSTERKQKPPAAKKSSRRTININTIRGRFRRQVANFKIHFGCCCRLATATKFFLNARTPLSNTFAMKKPQKKVFSLFLQSLRFFGFIIAGFVCIFFFSPACRFFGTII